ncbi:MAG: DUF4878 domain-containing protein [Kiritimatiellae bacterium]|nr:DUF4878 domain-containing protein [Kiritimatiellia bacterium]
MKKLIMHFLAVASVALLLAGCNGPDDVAVRFYEKLADGKAQEAAELATGEASGLVAAFGGGAAKELKGASFKAVDTKIDGDKAKVKVEVTKDGKTDTEEVDLVKENGEWKVVIDKK